MRSDWYENRGNAEIIPEEREAMELTVKDERKLVEIWLTNAEKADPVLRAGLQSIYDKFKKKKYLVAVFESGNGDIYEQTRDLLLYDRRSR